MLYGMPNPHGGDIYGGDVRLDFSANTNPFGTPPGVLEAVSRALPTCTGIRIPTAAGWWKKSRRLKG